MNKNLLYLLLLLFASCSQEVEKSSKVFFAGEIVNPTSDRVFLYRGNTKLDSAALDENHRFSFLLDSIKEGLHHFNHGPENQYVFLNKGDSIQIRLNTIDFDESLVFTGDGSEINNFLIDLFLENEKEEKLILPDYFDMDAKEFDQSIEALRKEKLAILDVLKSEVDLSLLAKEIAEVSINYTYYNYKEKYPFEHRRKTGEQILNSLPKDFYAYRALVNFDRSSLNYLTPYYDFVKSHFTNLSYVGCAQKCGVENEQITNHLHFNRHKLNLIDSLVSDTELKDNLFRKVAYDYLLMGRDTETNNEVFITDFHLRSGNNRHMEEITKLYDGIRNIQPNKEIPNLLVTDNKGNQISLQEIAKNKKVVFYFWSGANKRYFKDTYKRINELSETKKEYTFVGINHSTEETRWKGMIKQAHLNPTNQYKAENYEELTKALIIYPMNKCIITEDAKIVDAFSTMWTSAFLKI